MPNTSIVNSLDLPELEPYRTLRRPLDHKKAGIFVAEGEKIVRRLLDSKISIVSMLMTPEWYHKLSQTDNSTTRHFTTHRSFIIYLAEKHLLETIVGYNLHQGIMAVAKVPKQCSLDNVVRSIPKPHFLVALDGLVNAENVGVVVRNCAGFGVDAVIVGETSSSPYLRRAVRNSMGAVFHIHVVHVDSLITALRTLHQHYGTRTIAAHPHEQSTIHQIDFSGNICIVFGNEGTGVSAGILSLCTHHAAIPMTNQTDSLNVASASAVFLYDASKQRNFNQRRGGP